MQAKVFCIKFTVSLIKLIIDNLVCKVPSFYYGKNTEILSFKFFSFEQYQFVLKWNDTSAREVKEFKFW